MSTAAVHASRPFFLFRHARALRLLATAALLLLIIRLLLPWLLARAVNHRLSEMPGHQGVVGDIDLGLWRGAYRLRDFTIREAGEDGRPVFSVKTADLSLSWRELVHGRIVSDIVLDAPILHLARASAPGSGPAPAPKEDWRKLIKDLWPIQITRLEIRDGVLNYADPGHEPPVSIGLDRLGGRIDGLANRAPPKGDNVPARGEITAAIQGGGRLLLRARGAWLEHPPVVEAETEIRDVNLPALNTLLRAALGVDVSAGALDVDAEFRTAGGLYEGYVKPLARGIRYADAPGQPGGALKAVREKLVGAASSLLTNNDTKKVGTRIPFSGDFNDNSVERWPAFVTLLRNGFGRAIREGVDGSVTGGGI